MLRIQDAEPSFKAPPHACDAHFHVFGPPARYPYASGLRYAPPLAPLADYLVLARHLGLERFVFVQPSAYGRDNSCMLDAMRELPGSRGIVDIDEHIGDAELAKLHTAGVRGVRINVSPVHPPEPGLAERLLPRVRRLEARCAELGWHLDFLLPGWLTAELWSVLRSLKVDFTVAHFGMFRPREGIQTLLDLVKGRGWIKLTGVYRMSTTPGFADVAPMARALVEAAPDRLIWGSDYPHLSFADKVGSVELFNLLGDWANEGDRRRILADNPARLFGFPS